MMVLVLAVAGCGGGGGEGAVEGHAPPVEKWSKVEEGDLTAAENEQFGRALAAQQEMASTMMAELEGELESGGPSGAVVVCRDMAPMIAEYVADEHGLAIGRTSNKLRNPANAAPKWAAEPVAAGTAEKAFYRGPHGKLGVLLPIKTAAPCLACHGEPESLDDSVVGALAESYPDDRALGFAEGDLRGWFWVEVPESS